MGGVMGAFGSLSLIERQAAMLMGLEYLLWDMSKTYLYKLCAEQKKPVKVKLIETTRATW